MFWAILSTLLLFLYFLRVIYALYFQQFPLMVFFHFSFIWDQIAYYLWLSDGKQSQMFSKGLYSSIIQEVKHVRFVKYCFYRAAESVASNGKAPTDPIRHVVFPPIPICGPLAFHVTKFVFSLVALSLQYLNMYRTVYWLGRPWIKYPVVRSYFSSFYLDFRHF